VFCKEPIRLGLVCADSEFLGGVSLDAFNLPCKYCSAYFAVVFPKSKPTNARDYNNRGKTNPMPSHHIHDASVLFFSVSAQAAVDISRLVSQLLLSRLTGRVLSID
jgi:hypothetical protein